MPKTTFKTFSKVLCLLLALSKGFAQTPALLQLEVIPCPGVLIKKELKDSLENINRQINQRKPALTFAANTAKFNYQRLLADTDKRITHLFGSQRYLFTIQLWIGECQYPYPMYAADCRLEDKAPVIGPRVRDIHSKTFYTVAQLDAYFKQPKYLFTDSLFINLQFLVKPGDSLQVSTDKGKSLLPGNGNTYAIKGRMFYTLFQPASFKLTNLNNKRIATKGRLVEVPKDIKEKVLDWAKCLNNIEDMDALTKTDFTINYTEKLLNATNAVDTDDLIRWLRSNKVNLK